MVRRFEAWGYSAGFATFIGLAECLGGVLILVPKTRRFGAGIIAADMVGAIFTHLRTGIGSPSLAGIYLALAAVILWRGGRTKPTDPDASTDSPPA